MPVPNSARPSAAPRALLNQPLMPRVQVTCPVPEPNSATSIQPAYQPYRLVAMNGSAISPMPSPSMDSSATGRAPNRSIAAPHNQVTASTPSICTAKPHWIASRLQPVAAATGFRNTPSV